MELVVSLACAPAGPMVILGAEHVPIPVAGFAAVVVVPALVDRFRLESGFRRRIAPPN